MINLELAFADLAQVEKRLERLKKDRKADETEKSALEKAYDVLMQDEPARNADLTDEEELAIKSFGLLTAKKMIYAANVADEDLATGNEMVEKLRQKAEKEGARLVVVSAQVRVSCVLVLLLCSSRRRLSEHSTTTTTTTSCYLQRSKPNLWSLMMNPEKSFCNHLVSQCKILGYVSS